MRELVKSYDVWNPISEKLDHIIIVWKEGDNYYQSEHSATNGSFDIDSLPVATPIPMHIFKGCWDPSLTESPPLAPVDSFLKRPRIIVLMPDDYDTDKSHKHDLTRTPGDFLVQEAKVYEILKQHPHPNIGVYYGCVLWTKDPTLNHTTILEGISKGLQFLHEALGLVHNDINPSNVMLDDAGNPVIIDFDSCIPIGEEIGLSSKCGTFTWTPEPEPTKSLPENDMYGLAQIGEFLEGGKRS
ncbi:hypothetical protein AZE42_10150 [Rhizopogon vesiculosus]|uniref:Protein kinase domain-containing protein n=1 Tax=Rhizopogon vesiculosus TaxID=180088 RepID=A0A1J8PSN6_9AGAM|nr:hypothetical protein AZE42_10150 [Rhizopogon vesiculosus]